MSTSCSVRFYLKNTVNVGDKTMLDSLKGIMSYKNKYYEVKVDNHLRTFPEEFISLEFQQAIRPFLDRITLMTEDWSWANGSHVVKKFELGQTQISFDNYRIMMKGKNLMVMVKLLNIFCDRKGEISGFVKAQTNERSELAKLRNVNHKLASEVKTLNSQLNSFEIIVQNLQAAGKTIMEENEGLRKVLKDTLSDATRPWWVFWK